MEKGKENKRKMLKKKKKKEHLSPPQHFSLPVISEKKGRKIRLPLLHEGGEDEEEQELFNVEDEAAWKLSVWKKEWRHLYMHCQTRDSVVIRRVYAARDSEPRLPRGAP